MRYNKGSLTAEPEEDDDDDSNVPDEQRRLLKSVDSTSGRESQSRKSSVPDTRETTYLLRRRSSGGSGSAKPKPIRSNTQDLRQHLKHLGPSNVASRPKSTKYTSVKIKPGVGTIPEGGVPPSDNASIASRERGNTVNGTNFAPDGGAGAGLLSDAGKDAKDGATAVSQGYGTIKSEPIRVASEAKIQEEIDADMQPNSPTKSMSAAEASAYAERNTEPAGPSKSSPSSPKTSRSPPEKMIYDASTSRPASQPVTRSNSSHSTLGELNDVSKQPSKSSRRAARSGSITQQLVDVGGMKKMVLETTSSSDTEDNQDQPQTDGANDEHPQDEETHDERNGAKKKKKKKRGGKKTRSKETKNNGSAGGSS